MSYAVNVLRATLRKLLLAQALLVLTTAVGFLAAKGGHTPLAALFGGAVALLNTAISAHRLQKASEVAAGDAHQGMLQLYLGAAMRFVLTPLFIALGIAALGLDPIALIVGFAVAQLGYLFNNVKTGT
jgi:ATP synthase protein I